MTVLTDLTLGDAIVVLGRVTDLGAPAGITLSMLGPDGTAQGTLTVSLAGTFGGQLAFPADQVPVQLVPELALVSPGDVMVNNSSGETMVARVVRIMPDGSCQWAASSSALVWYPSAGWNRAGTATMA